jgi:hypothetical protein
MGLSLVCKPANQLGKCSFSYKYQLFLCEIDTHIDRDLLKRPEPAKKVTVRYGSAISPGNRHSHRQGLTKIVLDSQDGLPPTMDQLFLRERNTHIRCRDLL